LESYTGYHDRSPLLISLQQRPLPKRIYNQKEPIFGPFVTLSITEGKMSRFQYSITRLTLVLILSAFLAACRFLPSQLTIDVGPTQTESQTVDAGGATAADVEINMGTGELQIGGASPSLMTANFTYNVAEWRPEVVYNVTGTRGRLEVKQPEFTLEGIPGDDIEYTWTLGFNETIPLDMAINLGVGENMLDLSRLNLTGLTVRTGVGETTLNLNGAYPQDFDVDILGGVGSTTVTLPTSVGVRLETQSGIGSVNVVGLRRDGSAYINDSYGVSPVTMNVKVQGGVGEITVESGD
jgi:hypothetical protein